MRLLGSPPEDLTLPTKVDLTHMFDEVETGGDGDGFLLNTLSFETGEHVNVHPIDVSSDRFRPHIRRLELNRSPLSRDTTLVVRSVKLNRCVRVSQRSWIWVMWSLTSWI